MKILIVYGSRHHGNTRRLVEYLEDLYSLDSCDAEAGRSPDLSGYDLIGFASGLDFGKFYPSVTELARALPAGKQVFALFTCARDNGRYGDEIRDIAQGRSCAYLGKYGCRGFNTYGPWKWVGGMNKNHPSQGELDQAAAFVQGLIDASGIG